MTYQMASKLLIELLKLERMGETVRKERGGSLEDWQREIDQLIKEKLNPDE